MTIEYSPTKISSIRYPSSIDGAVDKIIALNMEAHNVVLTRNKVLSSALIVGLDQMINSYQGDLKHD